MSNNGKHQVQEQIRAHLLSLSPEERVLLSKILQIERDNLHQQKPRIREDLLRAVREVIK